MAGLTDKVLFDPFIAQLWLKEPRYVSPRDFFVDFLIVFPTARLRKALSAERPTTARRIRGNFGANTPAAFGVC
jgi:hypothetical protein